MAEKQKRLSDLVGALLIGLGTLVGTPFVVLITTLPLGMLDAWIRLFLWRWYAVPYLHLPSLAFWQMFALGLVLRVFKSSDRALKDDHYAGGMFSYICVAICCDLLVLLTGWILHLTILKG